MSEEKHKHLSNMRALRTWKNRRLPRLVVPFANAPEAHQKPRQNLGETPTILRHVPRQLCTAIAVPVVIFLWEGNSICLTGKYLEKDRR